MLFSSNTFLFAFLPLTAGIYYLCPRRLRNGWLLVASLFFYGWGEPKYLFVMLGDIFMNYLCGLWAHSRKVHGKSRKLPLWTGIALNLLLLCFFKYGKFFFGDRFPEIPLPIGISFYVFQAMSYLIDVCWDRVPVQRSLLTFSTYVTLFPQLIAGPIVRYRDVADMLESRRETVEQFARGTRRFVIGLSKKLLLANTFGSAWNVLQTYSGAPAFLGLLCCSLQIYFDFSGYSDMAIGLGMMFGFHFDENFNYPYISKSASEFWRRWHISLGSFFRDYVYIPMGGNRRHQILNLAVVWFLTGLWHGASWNFILWGLYFGLLVVIEKLFLGKILEKIPSFFSHLYLIIAAIFGWALFYFEDMSRLGKCLSGMFGGNSAPLYDEIALSSIKSNCFIIIAAIILCCPVCRVIKEKINGLADKTAVGFAAAKIGENAVLFGILIVSSLLLVNQSYNPFLYFRY